MRLIIRQHLPKNAVIALMVSAALFFAQAAIAQTSSETKTEKKSEKKIDKKTESKTASPDMPLDLVGLWNEAKANNPQLRQLRETYLSAKAIPPQIRAPNNPQIGFVWANTPTNSPLGLGLAETGVYSFTQSFPFPGKKTIAASAADDAAESILAQNDNTALQLASQIAASYYSTISAQKQLNYLKEAILRLEMIKNLTKARYANNAAAFSEFLNAQVAQSSAEADKFALEKQIDVALRTINTLVGRDPREKILLRSEAEFKNLSAPTLIELEDFAESNHPVLKSSKLQLDAARKQLTLAKMAYLPDFQVIASSNTTRGPFTGGVTATSYQVEFDVVIPLYFFMKERYGVEQAARNKYAFEANDIAVKQQVLLGVDSAYATYEQAKSQVLFLRDRQIPEATAAYKVALTAYANNGQGFNDLLVAQNQLRGLQIQLAIADSNLAQAHAGLLAAAGKDPLGN